MKSNLLKVSILLLILLIVVAFDTASAAGATRPFGGRITNTKATEIQSLENSNYKCTVPGTTITIKPVTRSSPTTFLIPSGVKSKTGYTPRAGQQIKGLYSQSKTSIVCIYQGYPPSQTTTQLTPITMYGTSR
ncbi:MAG: hypothetical protein AAB895_00220 [Patescibacteria group bacterium]